MIWDFLAILIICMNLYGIYRNDIQDMPCSSKHNHSDSKLYQCKESKARAK